MNEDQNVSACMGVAIMYLGGVTSSLVLTRPSYISFVQRVWDLSIDKR